VGKITKKNHLKECVFVNSALKLRQIGKNTLLQTDYSEILPTGNNVQLSNRAKRHYMTFRYDL